MGVLRILFCFLLLSSFAQAATLKGITGGSTIKKEATNAQILISAVRYSIAGFRVSNDGGDTLTYTIADDVDWLSCYPDSGDSTGEYDTIAITYDTAGLSNGTYWGTITVTSPEASNSPQYLIIKLVKNGGSITTRGYF